MRSAALWLLDRTRAVSVPDAFVSESMADAAAGCQHRDVEHAFNAGAVLLLDTYGLPALHNPTSTPIEVSFWDKRREHNYARSVLGSTTLLPNARLLIPHWANAALEWRRIGSAVRVFNRNVDVADVNKWASGLRVAT